MLVKPTHKLAQIEHHAEPPVLAFVMDNQLHGPTNFGGFGGKPFGLFQRRQRVGVSVMDQYRRQIARDKINRGRFAPDHPPHFEVGGLRTKRAPKTLGWTAVAQVFPGTPQVQQVGDGKENGHRLHRAAGAVHRIRRLRRSRSTARGQHQTQMPARAAAGDAEMFRVHPVFGGVISHEPHRAMHILDNLHHRRLRLRHVINGKDGVTPAQKRGGQPGAK
ncbi:MAG: hypothetical protein BWX84_01984 [Verrucomicrobia bacterium ADurb.Bin118]|nr:MAG: hypothetical protein BWX84_01984 [Verrucomicrobia bacterium ADurb.Bin118]